ncbi:MAG TPA: isocitrate lyase/phosphoenolpyruvate mutase family protein [Lysobacter sp.]|nr:isocitrate lyase/phosphoenolpyruvate mutase family protein [Lysobacter sp.]
MSSTLHARFVELHRTDRPLLLANAWDAASARLLQDAGAPAVATSSAAVAWSRGYADGGALPREELLSSLAGIVRVTQVPVTADIEDGYGDDPVQVAALVADVAVAGAVGINLEDGGGDPALLAAKIRAIRARLGGTPLFVNARTDVYLRGLAEGEAAVRETIARLRIYRDAGADGGFVPGLVDAAHARAVADAVDLRINVMARPGLAPIADLAAAGVCRISVGPWLFYRAYTPALDAARAFLAGDVGPMLQPGLDFATLNRLFG